MNTISVITAITAKKDNLRPQPIYPDVDYIAFMDEEILNPAWQVRKACNKFANPVMNAKIHKILTHLYVDNPYIVWMDGSMALQEDPHKLIEFMGEKDFAFFRHHSRMDLYKEIKACLQVKRGNREELLEQKEEYLKRLIPPKLGMAECTAFVRKNNPKANAVFEKWWAEICRYSSRDQISWPVAFRNEKWAVIPGNVLDKNDFFEHVEHINR